MPDNDKSDWENPWPSSPKPDITPAPLNPPETEAMTEGGTSGSMPLSGTYSLPLVKQAFNAYLIDRHACRSWAKLDGDERRALVELHWELLQEALVQTVVGQGGEQ